MNTPENSEQTDNRSEFQKFEETAARLGFVMVKKSFPGPIPEGGNPGPMTFHPVAHIPKDKLRLLASVRHERFGREPKRFRHKE